MTNWISVNERLPDENIEVLGVCDKGIMWVTSHQNNFFTDHDFNFVEITHWMPLPEPPEADMTTNKQVIPKHLEMLLQKIPQQPQRQDSTHTQLSDLYAFAVRLGMYDAADAIRAMQ